MRKLLFFAVLITGCSARYTPTERSVRVKKETKRMLRSHINKVAGAEADGFTYYFILNENNTFSAVTDIHATKQYDFCAGTFQYNGDTLNLNYYKDQKSQYLTEKAVIDNDKNEIYFLNTDLAKTKRLKVLNEL